MDDIKSMVIKTALKKMMDDGHFSICTIDSILKITGGIPDSHDYDMLHALHCVNYKIMPAELLKELPVLIGKVLNSEGIKLDYSILDAEVLLDRH